MEPVHWIKIALDLIATGLGLVLYQYLVLFAVPFKSSFYCADYYTINLPFKKSTVTNAHLYTICLAVPLFVFFITEAMRTLYFRFESSPMNLIKTTSNNQHKKHLIHSSSTTSSSSNSSNSSRPSPIQQHSTNNNSSSNNSSSIAKKRQRYFYKIKLTSGKHMSLPEEFGNMYVNCGSFLVGILATGRK